MSEDPVPYAVFSLLGRRSNELRILLQKKMLIFWHDQVELRDYVPGFDGESCAASHRATSYMWEEIVSWPICRE